jgi:hypothetical protein
MINEVPPIEVEGRKAVCDGGKKRNESFLFDKCEKRKWSSWTSQSVP